MIYNKCLDIKALEYKLNNTANLNKRTHFYLYLISGIVALGLLISAIVFQFIFGLYLIVMLGVGLLANAIKISSIEVGNEMTEQTSNRIKVFGSHTETDYHFAEFTNEYKSTMYYIPEENKNIENCNFIATDNYIAFFAYKNMYLVPIESLIYVYGHAYQIKHVETQIVLLFRDGQTFEINYDKKVIIAVEQFLLNMHGVLVGFSRENKKESIDDFYNFREKCEIFAAERKSILKDRSLFQIDIDYPYSFLTKLSNPKKYAGAFMDMVYSMIFLLFGIPLLILDLLAPSMQLIRSIIMVVVGIFFLLSYFKKKI